MKFNPDQIKTAATKANTLAAALISLACWQALGLGADHRNNHPIGGNSLWPTGLKELVNTTNRVHGYFVNAEDIFFFSGTATNFSEFLHDYSKIEGIQRHRLILHPGTGEAKSPWAKEGRPCDWKLDGCPAAWREIHASRATPKANTNYALEVHFWMGETIKLDRVAIPANVEFGGDCLKRLQAITNGMTRAEVEQRLQMDGGLQGASPVRFIDPDCPGFKINVEFDYQHDAAGPGRAIFGKADHVIRVSKPYLEPAFND